MTLVEILVALAVVGILIVPITVAISIVFRSSRITTDSVAQSHDLQQLVNYLPIDARAGSIDPAGYRTSSDDGRGSGCSPDGNDNVLRIEDGSPTRQRHVAYRLVDDGTGTAELDRYECDSDGTVLSVVNIADSLVADGTHAAATSSIVLIDNGRGATSVERVELSINQARGPETVSATPLAETPLGSTASAGECTNDLLEATQGFTTFTEDVVHLRRGDTKRSSAVGGILSWEGLATLGQNLSASTGYPDVEPTRTSLYIQSIDWAASSGELRIPGGYSDVVIADMAGVTISADGRRAYGPAGTSGPYVNAQNGRIGGTGTVIDFEAAFITLRACSHALAALPDSCAACAEHVELWDQNNSAAYPGIGNPGGANQVNVRLHPAKANVLNLDAAALDAIGNLVFRWKPATGGSGTAVPTESAPLIINVADAGDVVLRSLPLTQQGTPHILYNFPNATSVTITNGSVVWGTILAPEARVVTETQTQGGVVAKHWQNNGAEINTDRYFSGTIDWDAT